MEGNFGVNRKMILSLMMLMMVVLAQGGEVQADGHEYDHQYSAEYNNVHHYNPAQINISKCVRKCGLKCVMFLISPPRFALCFGICMVGCKAQPPQSVMDCTTGCANSLVNTYTPTDSERVDNFVGSCYESCKQKKNN